MEIINGIDQDDIGGDCTDIDGATIDDSIIGGTTPASGSFTTLEATGQLQGALINNQMVQKATFDILGLMTDPRFLNLQCEDPGAGTMTDVGGQSHDGTYQGTMTTGDRVKKGMGWAVDPDAIDDYIDLGNHNDFSFGNGSNDEAVTWFGVIEVVAIASIQAIMSKWDNNSAAQAREFIIRIEANRTMRIYFYDESLNRTPHRATNASVSTGYHSFAITYPGDAGATAMDNVKFHIDGSLVASTADNKADYVAMENLSVPMLIGASKDTDGNIENCVAGDIALIGVDGSEWSAFDIHRFHQLCKGLYGI